MALVKKDDDEDNLKVSLTNESIYLPPKRKVKVLDEETFISKLDEIIEKSFFPDLEKLRLQEAYYKAVKNNDYETVRQLYDKYSHYLKSTRSNDTPMSRLLDTPGEQRSQFINPEPPRAQSPDAGKKVPSLDSFLAKNTSEDNVSFETILRESEKKESAKLHQVWLHEKEKLLKLQSGSNMMLENSTTNDTDVIKSLDSWTYTSKNTLMYVPDGAPLTSEEQLIKSKAVRVINHANTRFTPEALNSLYRVQSQAQPSTSEKLATTTTIIPKVGVDGKEQGPRETPRVKGYAFVEPTPSPAPGRMFGDESPMMVWGEIESTPMALDPSSTPRLHLPGAPEFKIPEMPARERLAHDLEEKASAERRGKRNEALKQVRRNLSSPYSAGTGLSPGISSPHVASRISSMSPAAQKLLSTKLNLSKIIKTPNSSSKITNSPFGVSPSPKLVRTPASTRSSTTDPSSTLDSLKSSVKRPSDSLTDNLLKLPKNS